MIEKHIKKQFVEYTQHLEVAAKQLRIEKQIIENIMASKYKLTECNVVKFKYMELQGPPIEIGECFQVALDILQLDKSTIVIGIAENMTHLPCFHAWNKLHNHYIDATWQEAFGFLGIKYWKLMELSKDQYLRFYERRWNKNIVGDIDKLTQFDFYQLLCKEFLHKS